MHKLFKLTLIPFCCLAIAACTTTTPPGLTTKQKSELEQGKREFTAGMYKKARNWLMPLAVDGNPEAEYGIGYMYYYGYGTTQDTDTGFFWIKRSADKGYPPAVQALAVIHHQGNPG